MIYRAIFLVFIIGVVHWIVYKWKNFFDSSISAWITLIRKFSLTRWGSELYLVLEDLNWCYFNNLSLLFKNRIVIMQNFFDIKSLLKCHYKCTLFKIYKVLQRSMILKSNKFLCFNCIQFLLIASLFFLIIYQLCSYKLFRIIKLYTYTEIKQYSPCRG